LQDGDFLCYKGQLYVPDHQATRLDVLHSCHDHAHRSPGITKTIKNIRRHVYWPKMVAFVTDYIHFLWQSVAAASPYIISHLALIVSS